MLRKLATQWGLALVIMATTALVWAHPPKVVVIPSGGDDAPTFKTIFVTPETYTGDLKDETKGDLDGPSGADRRCMEFAEAPDSKVKGKQFKAWLSSGGPATFNGSNREFVIHDLPYHNVNGEVIFADLWNLSVVHTNDFFSHNGVQVFGDSRYPWTAIASSGRTTLVDCADWTNGTNSYSGSYGFTDSAVAGSWTNDATALCYSRGGLYCVEQ